jgi:hydrogenase maturation factor
MVDIKQVFHSKLKGEHVIVHIYLAIKMIDINIGVTASV